MADQTAPSTEASPEQMLYAKILELGMFVGLAILFLTFAIYVFGIMKPYLPFDQLSHYWSIPVHEYLEEAKIQPGWNWVGLLGYGDFINFIGIALLAGATIICYASIIPLLLKNKDKIYAGFALAEVIILALAASGFLAVGH